MQKLRLTSGIMNGTRCTMPYKDPAKKLENNRKVNAAYYARIRSERTPRYERMLKEQSEASKLRRANFTPEERERDARQSASRHLRRKYKITLMEYESMLASQNGTCKICHEPDNTDRRLAVDHCHKTGRVRGLLCYRCNTVIGHMKESVELFASAIRYLDASCDIFDV